MASITPCRRRRGMMILDALAGLFLLAALATLLTTATHARSRSALHLSHQREAVAVAQEAMDNLASTGEARSSNAHATINVRRTGQHIGSSEWVEVTAVVEGHRATLVGLARGGVK